MFSTTEKHLQVAIQPAEVINLPLFFFFSLTVIGNFHIHPPIVGAEMLTKTAFVWCGTGCHGQEKDVDERLMQRTVRTGLTRGHCGHSKFLADIADTYCAEITESSHC